MLTILMLILIFPGMICLYALILRPLMARIPALKDFYSRANGFWETLWAWCGNSVTILWAKILGGFGMMLELVDPLATALGDPQLKDQVTSALQSNPKYLGWFAIGVSIITISARLSSLGKSS